MCAGILQPADSQLFSVVPLMICSNMSFECRERLLCTHCPRNNRNLRIKTEPATLEAASIYILYLAQKPDSTLYSNRCSCSNKVRLLFYVEIQIILRQCTLLYFYRDLLKTHRNIIHSAIRSHRSFDLSEMSDALTSLTKKEEMSENERFAHCFVFFF